jgi:hypothetical protein
MESEEMVRKIENIEKRLMLLESRFVEAAVQDKNNEAKISISEFLSSKDTKSDVKKTVVFAYYIDKYENTPEFTAENILNCFIRSRSTKPANISDKINKCIAKGWISENVSKKEGRKTFYITQTGIQITESNFSGEVE